MRNMRKLRRVDPDEARAAAQQTEYAPLVERALQWAVEHKITAVNLEGVGGVRADMGNVFNAQAEERWVIGTPIIRTGRLVGWSGCAPPEVTFTAMVGDARVRVYLTYNDRGRIETFGVDPLY